MPLALMSNPGLHLALLGNPRRRRKHHFSRTTPGSAAARLARWRWHHNPRRRRVRTNPMKALSGYISAVKKAPKDILATFKGAHKVRNALFATGGAVGTYFLGGMATAKVIVPALNAVGAGNAMNNAIAKRVIGGMVPFTLGYVASKFIKGDIGKALAVGGAVASLFEIAAPGLILRLVNKVPAVGTPTVAAVAAAAPAAAAGPVNGMEGLGTYVDSPSYQGTGEYVDSPSYQGTGEYVDSPSYQGTGDVDDDALASGELADGYVDESADYLNSYLNAGSTVSAN